MAATALFYCWRRRRHTRARALLPMWQNPAPGTPSTTDHAPGFVTVLPADALPEPRQFDDVGPESPTRTPSVMFGSSHDAQDGSAGALEGTPSSRPPTPDVHLGGKHAGHSGQEPPRLLSPPVVLPDAESLLAITRSPGRIPDVSEAVPESVTVGAYGERLLHFALPWVFGQRMLAILAREDTHSVDSRNSEPLPAYEPRA
ncbi:hypothetical protein VTO73DRAFT_9035 [Trametes versicolor]